MATAIERGSTTPGARSGRQGSKLAVLEFLVHQDNGGAYQWEIIGERGESLAQTGGFASYDDAERAARCVHDGAGSARFAPKISEQGKFGVA
jgi:uncharacterized protein YegP (UPF0339 family)